jgi:hypothetical protein
VRGVVPGHFKNLLHFSERYAIDTVYLLLMA